jgi:hypothetical protein
MGAEEGKQRKRRFKHNFMVKRKSSYFLHGEVFFNLTRTLMGVPKDSLTGRSPHKHRPSL